jgi:hypothetical protein
MRKNRLIREMIPVSLTQKILLLNEQLMDDPFEVDLLTNVQLTVDLLSVGLLRNVSLQTPSPQKNSAQNRPLRLDTRRVPCSNSALRFEPLFSQPLFQLRQHLPLAKRRGIDSRADPLRRSSWSDGVSSSWKKKDPKSYLCHGCPVPWSATGWRRWEGLRAQGGIGRQESLNGIVAPVEYQLFRRFTGS